MLEILQEYPSGQGLHGRMKGKLFSSKNSEFSFDFSELRSIL